MFELASPQPLGRFHSACAAANGQGTQKSGSNSSHKTWRLQEHAERTTKNKVNSEVRPSPSLLHLSSFIIVTIIIIIIINYCYLYKYV